MIKIKFNIMERFILGKIDLKICLTFFNNLKLDSAIPLVYFIRHLPKKIFSFKYINHLIKFYKVINEF